MSAHRNRVIALVLGAALICVASRSGAQPSGPALPPITDADRAAAFPELGDTGPHAGMPEDPFNKLLRFDQLEAQDADGGDVLNWDFKGWVGGGLDRLWIRSEGERTSGTTEHAELQLLWGHAVGRWWDLVAGVRQDFRPGPSQGWAAVGIQGLAPYRFELEATAFLGESGRTGARFEAEYELLITNRLILQPLIELNWYGQDDAKRAIGSGLSSAETGLRLRYEFRREVAPYVGLVRERVFGGTADYARASGADTRDTRFAVGIRLWF